MIKVVKAGFGNTIQDKGRFGFASFGVPVSGAMDSYSADLANTILNNNLNDAVLEINFGNCEFQFLVTTQICISGSDASAKINGESVLLNAKINIKKNDILSFGKPILGTRTYVAVKGGVKTEMKLGSRSYYPNITNESFIKKEDLLPIQTIDILNQKSSSSIKINKLHFSSKTLECHKAPEFDLLSSSQKEQLFDREFTISKDNSRMGYKLNETLKNNLPQMLTSAVLPGTVQLTPSGKIIILMRDCQTTGGYPRILQLTENAINKLAQKTTNDAIQFVLG